jgi:hypothetical protein
VTGGDAAAPRWRGQAGRLEVWYATVTDAASGTGVWVHHEVVAPVQGDPFSHGWATVFEPDRPPVLERFGPVSPEVARGGDVFAAGPVRAGRGRATGAAGSLAWDLAGAGGGPPLFTFPRWAWQREALPGAQLVVDPGARWSGQVEVAGRRVAVDGPGALAHIYGHGNAERWAWLHADLDEDTCLEVVTAVSRRPGLRRLPPLGFVQLRRAGRDWPRSSLAAAPLLRARIALPDWRIAGIVGRQRLRVGVHLPPGESVAVDYADPDGAPAVCTNSERADATVLVERWSGRWRTQHRWSLRGTAHAEVGLRPGS